MRLAAFNLPQIQAITDHDNMDLYTLGEQKCALFAVIPDNDDSFAFLVSLLYSQVFQALYYSADQIHHGALPRHVHLVLDEFAALRLPGFTRELATMRSRNISASTIIQNMAQIKSLYKDDWETIPGNSDTILYLGRNEQTTHEYISKMLGKSTIDTQTHGQTKGRSGSYSTNQQSQGRELLTPDKVRKLDNRYYLLFIQSVKPVMDRKYNLKKHPAMGQTSLGGAAPTSTMPHPQSRELLCLFLLTKKGRMLRNEPFQKTNHKKNLRRFCRAVPHLDPAYISGLCHRRSADRGQQFE